MSEQDSTGLEAVRPLVTCRFLFQTAKKQLSYRPTPWQTGIAISLLQDSVELMLRQISSKADVRITEKTGFVAMLDKLTETQSIPSHSQLHELNRARVSFKHYGNLPAVEEGFRLGQYAESFLLWACDTYFSLDFRRVSLTSLITNDELRSEIEAAEHCLREASDAANEETARESIREAVLALARARWVLRNSLSQELPEVDSNLVSPPNFSEDRYGEATHELFRYIGTYLESLREFVLTLSQGVPNEYQRYLDSYLPSTSRSISGIYHYTSFRQRTNPSVDEINRCIDIVTETAIGGDSKR